VSMEPYVLFEVSKASAGRVVTSGKRILHIDWRTSEVCTYDKDVKTNSVAFASLVRVNRESPTEVVVTAQTNGSNKIWTLTCTTYSEAVRMQAMLQGAMAGVIFAEAAMSLKLLRLGGFETGEPIREGPVKRQGPAQLMNRFAVVIPHRLMLYTHEGAPSPRHVAALDANCGITQPDPKRILIAPEGAKPVLLVFASAPVAEGWAAALAEAMVWESAPLPPEAAEPEEAAAYAPPAGGEEEAAAPAEPLAELEEEATAESEAAGAEDAEDAEGVKEPEVVEAMRKISIAEAPAPAGAAADAGDGPTPEETEQLIEAVDETLKAMGAAAEEAAEANRRAELAEAAAAEAKEQEATYGRSRAKTVKEQTDAEEEAQEAAKAAAAAADAAAKAQAEKEEKEAKERAAAAKRKADEEAEAQRRKYEESIAQARKATAEKSNFQSAKDKFKSANKVSAAANMFKQMEQDSKKGPGYKKTWAVKANSSATGFYGRKTKFDKPPPPPVSLY